MVDRPLSGRGLVRFEDFCVGAGIDVEAGIRLLRENKIAGSWFEDGRPAGFFDDELPSREQLLEWGVPVAKDYSPDALRSGAVLAPPASDRPSWTMSWD